MQLNSFGPIVSRPTFLSLSKGNINLIKRFFIVLLPETAVTPPALAVGSSQTMTNLI
jgi:hypothetical protein